MSSLTEAIFELRVHCNKVIAGLNRTGPETMTGIADMNVLLRKCDAVFKAEDEPVPHIPVHPFEFGAAVVDTDAPDFPMSVTGFRYFGPNYVEVECTYWTDSKREEVHVPAWRLREWDK